MKNLAIFFVVAFFESKDDLKENFPDNVLCHIVFLCLALLDQLGHVSILTVLHYDENLLQLFINYPKLRI